MSKAIALNSNISYGSVADKDIHSFIAAIKNGIEFSFFALLIKDSPFSLNEWSGFLNMSERTMQRYKLEKKSFDPIYAEKILEVTLLYNFGIEVFGNRERFNNWLTTKNLALGGIEPKELLDNTFGIGLLKDELTRIEYGILA